MDEKLIAKYLPKKKVILKLIVREGAMIKDPKHIGYGGFDGAITKLKIYYDRNLRRYIDPFNGNEEERKVFEEILKEQLHVYGDNPYWEKTPVTIIKDAQLASIGITYDLSNPNDNMAIKILKTNKNLVCEGWENRNKLPTYKYCILEEDYQIQQKASEFDKIATMGRFLGKIENSTSKMADFLNIYFSTFSKNKFVGENMSKDALKAQIEEIMSSDSKGYLQLISDPRYDEKAFVAKCINKNLINRRGINHYAIAGVDSEFTYTELLDKIKELQEYTDPVYMKMKAVLESK
jgi:hypothetical protein